jgi:hypothetical protein
MSDFSLDTDKNLVVTDGDLALISTDLDTLHANLMDRLLSSPGSLLHHPDFGGDLQDHVGGLPDDETLLQLAAVAKHQLLQDPRVASIDSCRALRALDLPATDPSYPSDPSDPSIILIVNLTPTDSAPATLAFNLSTFNS